MQLMRSIDSHTANKNVFSLCLNVSTEMSGARRSAGGGGVNRDVSRRLGRGENGAFFSIREEKKKRRKGVNRPGDKHP